MYKRQISRLTSFVAPCSSENSAIVAKDLYTGEGSPAMNNESFIALVVAFLGFFIFRGFVHDEIFSA